MAERKKPTIEELEAILNDPRSLVIDLRPDGEVDTIDSAGVLTLRNRVAALEASLAKTREDHMEQVQLSEQGAERIAKLETARDEALNAASRALHDGHRMTVKAAVAECVRLGMERTGIAAAACRACKDAIQELDQPTQNRLEEERSSG